MNTTETANDVKPAKTRKRTASSVFQELIMTNDGKTDLEIFKEVQKEFGADKIPDRHANYVGWYRGYLRKKGENPPAAVKPVKVAKAPAAKVEKTATPVVAPAPEPKKKTKSVKK